ncbi:MAG: type II toxin-antitoxin system HipA family toxin [Betaproteobacteria bacterium]|nr:type II toxin-antitoxin system HipA family toxin [Betaproteobacteria bacterium]
MGRKSRARALSVWVNGKLAGEWRIPPRGETEFRYDSAWTASEEGRPLSLSLPLSLDAGSIKGKAVECYFDNLLPDSDPIRKRLQERFHTASGNAFELLAAIGRDCVGAVQLLAPDEPPNDVQMIDATPLTEAEIERALIHTVSSPSFAENPADDEFRISIAGAQEKTAFLHHDGQWCRPLGATPTTHIFKLPLGLVGGMQADMTTSVENEWLCARILRAYGLPVPVCEIGRFGSQKVLVVERFDRQLHSSGKYWLRLVQEDFCQATTTRSSMKYERDGGPGMLEIARILGASVNRDHDLACLLKAQLLFWMLAATDGHAKNFSIRILSQGRFQLTPLYDVLSIWPIIGNAANKISWHNARLAMSVRGKNKHYLVKDIQRRHFNEMAARCGLGETAEPLIRDILAATPAVIASVQENLPEGFPQRVLDAILNGLTKSAKRLEVMPAT